MSRLKQPGIGVAGLVVFTCMLAYAGKDFTPPRAQHARTYPAHDDHLLEHVTIAIDPYDLASKASLFRTNWRETGYLPIRLIISNDGDKPITLIRMKVLLVTSGKIKMQCSPTIITYERSHHIT